MNGKTLAAPTFIHMRRLNETEKYALANVRIIIHVRKHWTQRNDWRLMYGPTSNIQQHS